MELIVKTSQYMKWQSFRQEKRNKECIPYKNWSTGYNKLLNPGGKKRLCNVIEFENQPIGKRSVGKAAVDKK